MRYLPAKIADSLRYVCEHEPLLFFFVFGVVFLTRLPFLDAGFGDPDAWRVFIAARHISETGEFATSRLPGYPVQEFVSSFLWRLGPIGLNGASAIMSAIAVGLFALIAKSLRYPAVIATSLALAFVPVFYIDSVQALDTPWALAFICGALLSTLKGRPLLAGALLGLAIGSRITSGAVAIPILILMFEHGVSARAHKAALIFGLSALLVGALCYVPVYSVYGASFFSTAGWEHNTPALKAVVTMFFDGVWGKLGKWAFILAILGAGIKIIRNSKGMAVTEYLTRLSHKNLAWLAGLALYLIAFLVFPYPRYLIPALPFAILLFGSVFSSRGMRLLTIGITIGAFSVTCNKSGICAGPVLSHYFERIADEKSVRDMISRARELGERNVIVVGSYLPKIEVLSSGETGGAEFAYLIDSAKAQTIIDSSLAVYHLHWIPEYNLRVLGVSLDSLGSRPLFPN